MQNVVGEVEMTDRVEDRAKKDVTAMVRRGINRRDFLKLAGAGLAGASLLGVAGCGGGGGQGGTEGPSR